MWEWVVMERGEGEEDENSEEEGEEEEEYPVQKEGWRIVFRLHEESVLSGIGALSLWVRVRAVRRRYEVNVICAGMALGWMQCEEGEGDGLLSLLWALLERANEVFHEVDVVCMFDRSPLPCVFSPTRCTRSGFCTCWHAFPSVVFASSPCRRHWVCTAHFCTRRDATRRVPSPLRTTWS